MPIVDLNGHQYTTADEEVRTRGIVKDLVEDVQRRIRAGVESYRPGQRLVIDLQGIEKYVDQAYFMGRNDG